MTKEELIKKYRGINVEDGWYKAVYNCFEKDMRDIGIEVENIYFSGFWSQGDGACFEGWVMDWGKFLRSVGYTDPVLIDHAHEHWYFDCKHRGLYFNEDCTVFDACLHIPDEFIAVFSPYEDDLRSQAWFAVLRQYADHAFTQEFVDVFRGYMRGLYRRLKAEYDYLTSDETVWEIIVANELEEAA